MSCSRKSLYGRITLLRRADSSAGSSRVLHSGTWQRAQPTEMNSASPVIPDFGVCGGIER